MIDGIATVIRGYKDRQKEARFQDFYTTNNLGNVSRAMLLGMVVFYAFFLWDYVIDPKNAPITHFIRGAVISPILAISAFLIIIPSLKRFAEVFVFIGTTVTATSLSYIYTFLDRGFEYGAAGIIIVMLYTYSLIPLRMKFILIFTAISLSVFILLQNRSDSVEYDIIQINTLYVAFGAALGLISCTWREISARDRFELTETLAASEARVSELLHSILPSDIVERIQRGEEAIADSHSDVAIVFIDLVGFTDLSRRLSAKHLVEILDGLFTEFDLACDKFGMERIKTIGDAYMAVAGLTHQIEQTNARAAAEFSLTVHRIVETYSSEHGIPLNVRIGMHVGPVVAGVIGRRKPAFDCWGESVNLASRLESIAAPGCIMISEASYWRLKDDFDVYAIDEIQLKGLGATTAYILRGHAAIS